MICVFLSFSYTDVVVRTGGESEENAVEGEVRSRPTDRQERHLSIAVAVEEDDIWACEKVCQLIKVLPKSYDIEKVRKTFQINITPTGVVLMQELERFNRLVAVVERDLIDLRNVSVYYLVQVKLQYG